MLKIITVIGTRPEAIKMAILIKKLNELQGIKHYLVVTAQHREMLDQVLDFFQIHADFDLNIMKENQQLADITASILPAITEIFDEIKPHIVFVHGDTTTCFATTLAAFYKHIKVAHIEAGLRTGNIAAPFPEEANRQLTTKLAAYHFAPTQLNVQNLIHEDINNEIIVLTGNTGIDSLLFTAASVQHFSDFENKQVENIIQHGDKFILVTGHRRENFGEGFLQICAALKEIAVKYPHIYIIYPVHLNPNVKEPVMKILHNIPNIILTQPLNYPDFILLMKKCWIILTDSGGIQEEGPSLGKPVLVMRDVTERPEAVVAGTVKLVGAKKENIIKGIEALINDSDIFTKMSLSSNPYGDGNATDRIIQWVVANEKNILAD